MIANAGGHLNVRPETALNRRVHSFGTFSNKKRLECENVIGYVREHKILSKIAFFVVTTKSLQRLCQSCSIDLFIGSLKVLQKLD